VTWESQEAPRLPDWPGRPLEIYQCLGRGRVHLLSGSYDDLPHAVEAFRAAIALDATYAPAHAGLARARCAQAVLRAVPHQEAFADAKASALRALAMDGGSAEAQLALGIVLFSPSGIGSAPLEACSARSTSIPIIPRRCCSMGRCMKRWVGSTRDCGLKRQALAREPRSPLVLVHIALSYWYQRRYDEALAWANQALDIDPKHLLAGVFVAGVYWKLGDIERFVAQNIRTAVAHGIADDALASVKAVTARMEQVYAKDGHAGWSRFMADEIEFMSTVPFRRAVLYGAAGCLDEAFESLDQAIASRDPATVHLAVVPQLDPLRPDPRFADRLRLMSLPEVASSADQT
jgi:tetratricopeptide (TPR) repeat protein